MVNSGWRFHKTNEWLHGILFSKKHRCYNSFFFKFTLPESQNLACTCLFPLNHENPSLKLFLKTLGYSTLIMHFFQANHHFHTPLGVSTERQAHAATPYFQFPTSGDSGSSWALATTCGCPFLIAAPIFFSFMFYSVLSLGTNAFI